MTSTSIKIVPKKSKKNTNKSIEEEYKKYTHQEHILELPDTYVGSIDKTVDYYWVLDDNKPHIEWKLISIVPALYKIFDEILVNAYDHYIRSKINHTKNSKVLLVKNIKVTIDKEKGEISIYNDGEGIPVEIHTEEQIYLPEMIFGNLLTSSNYDKNEKKITGGKNGYGAKLTNIYSNKFTIDTIDRIRKKIYYQEFTNNMNTIKKPDVGRTSNKKGYTKITFQPDYNRFKLTGLTDDIINIMKRRTYDIAACTDNSVNVYFNEELIKYSTFEKYVDLFIGHKTDTQRAFEICNERWEVGATISPSEKFEQVSFVNGIATTKGGKHVEYVANQIVNKLAELIKKKNGSVVKKSYIKENLIVFVKSTIEDPSFDSQTKENLTTPQSQFGSDCKVSDKFIQKLSKCGIVERVMSLNNLKDNKSLSKTDGKKKNTIRGIPKLDDANFAGTNRSNEATLILTEGDSAKTMAVSGLSEVGRDKWGVFPLRGKLLNVKDVNLEKIFNNEEINNLKKIIGLQSGKVYTNTNELRYGRIMLMTDQDHDGFHIKGLLFNLFHSLWPSLLEIGFLSSMLTPIVKVSKIKNTISFYNEKDYLHWKQENNEGNGWKIKYYKGLGTSNSNEAKEYFKKMHVVDYKWSETSDQTIDLAFNKSRANDRKKWLGDFTEEQILDTKETQVSYDQFINGELIQFSQTDLKRSIPNMVDGLKESQRKVLYGCFKKNLKTEIKVAQLAGYVSEQSAYHHGEASLNSTITNMAQNYVGANNINQLVPEGQFGTRLMGGKDAASPRYIHTYLNELSSHIYPKDDMPILKYINEDGFMVEPEYYIPIIPMILVNGSLGIGTGFSTTIPQFNPLDIITQLENKLTGNTMTEIKPWYRNFTGAIEAINETSYITKGCYRIIGKNQLEITELPIGSWSEDYKQTLETLLRDYDGGKKEKDKKQISNGPLKNYYNHCTESKVSILLEFMPDILEQWLEDKADYNGMNKIEKELKLTSTKYTNMSNMYLFNSKNAIQKYNTTQDIIDEFYSIRLETYQQRRLYQLNELKSHLNILNAKYKFILEFINDELVIIKRKKIELYQDLVSRNYPKYNNKIELMDLEQPDTNMVYYNYLIKMSIDTLTEEKLTELSKEITDIESQMEYLNKITARQLYSNELQQFKETYLKTVENSVKQEVKKSKEVEPNNKNTKPMKIKKKVKVIE